MGRARRAGALLALHLVMLRRLLVRDPSSRAVPHPCSRAREPTAGPALVVAAKPEENTTNKYAPKYAPEDRANDLPCLLGGRAGGLDVPEGARARGLRKRRGKAIRADLKERNLVDTSAFSDERIALSAGRQGHGRVERFRLGGRRLCGYEKACRERRGERRLVHRARTQGHRRRDRRTVHLCLRDTLDNVRVRVRGGESRIISEGRRNDDERRLRERGLQMQQRGQRDDKCTKHFRKRRGNLSSTLITNARRCSRQRSTFKLQVS